MLAGQHIDLHHSSDCPSFSSNDSLPSVCSEQSVPTKVLALEAEYYLPSLPKFLIYPHTTPSRRDTHTDSDQFSREVNHPDPPSSRSAPLSDSSCGSE